jgi:hypothetical protein
MFRNIDLFRAKKHPAWDPNEQFSRRIKNLPLYFLEYHHHTRNLKTESVTVTHYVPSRAEMMALAKIIQSYGNNLRVCDVGCGNGFIGSLLAREGVQVFGVDDNSFKQPQIPNFFDKDCYSKIIASIEDPSIILDVAFCSWMSPGTNLATAIAAKNPRLIIHLFSPDRQSDGSPTTGTTTAYNCPDNYHLLTSWSTLLPKDYFLQIGAPSGNPKTIRKVRIYAHNELEKECHVTPLGFSKLYDWDKEKILINTIRSSMGLQKYILVAADH